MVLMPGNVHLQMNLICLSMFNKSQAFEVHIKMVLGKEFSSKTSLLW